MRPFAIRAPFAATLLAATLVAATLVAAAALPVAAQGAAALTELHWRHIGPMRAGRARAAAGVPSRPNTFYIGFDNGGLWRSTDYGSNWVPLFDAQSTGSIGAIAVAPSNPDILYVGTGAGIIRPDLATGNGVYKSVDGGKTWTFLGLGDSQMIAMIEVDPVDPNRLYVAALGHPYGPNAERGVFRSVDGGSSFQKVLYRDEWTSANDVRIDPSNRNTLYATLWQQQQSFIEGGGFGGSAGIFKSTDGGTTWAPLTEGLPTVLQANLAIAPSNPQRLYATVAGATPSGAPAPIGFYTSADGGAHWTLAVKSPATGDPRPMVRIGGGDLPTLAVDGKNEKVVYSASTVFWRTEDAGLTWTAVRGAPGGDDYQRPWVNPLNSDILLVVSDQGGVVSANRGASWSNWYNQPTAAMYHVTTDNAFPYRVCSGQQDSGSACVDSRSMDGLITFHDWHPANIQEYGIAAPDPNDPELVYGSMRSGVSRYNRRTGQTTLVGPDMSARGPNGERFDRNVRTMPIAWSPVNPSVLFYTSNAVWKSTDHAKSWTRVSPDLARQSWDVPATAAKYAKSVTVAPAGAITALSLSPRSLDIIWAGTDDGNVQVTTDGGKKWTNVTPPSIKPWTRIYNMEAGHFDAKTAYIAANTFRLDDLNPHFFRTHDGGATWTEINNGIAGGAPSNSIREDPRTPGLLYAATDIQVWVSYDDGDHWESLRNDMPAIAVRDLQVKDDASCLCADLVAGTHGRGFWILDNITPLRQRAAARAAGTYLFRPAPAVRVRFATNEPTPWPPEMPAGENPLPGGIIDYQLASDARGPVRLEILDASAKVIRSWSSSDPVLTPDPGRDPEAYNKVCQANPQAVRCAVPLYWAAPAITLSNKAGFHRFTWELRMNPVTGDGITDLGDDDATGAVPHRTYLLVNTPYAPPGQYTARLTVDGTSYTQPITVHLDPRVKTSAPELAQLAAFSRALYAGAVEAHAAALAARALVAKLDGVTDGAALKAQIDSIAPPSNSAPRPRFRRRGASAEAPTLESASGAMLAAAMAVQGADVAPTASQQAAGAKARADGALLLARWRALSTTGIGALNAKRRAAGQPAIALP